MIAAEVGHLELASDYFGEAALIDLDNLEHNTRDGLHIASLAGTWIVAVASFGVMRDHGGALTFVPRLPERLDRLTFRLCFRGRSFTVSADAPVTRAIPETSIRDVPRQPPSRTPAQRRPA